MLSERALINQNHAKVSRRKEEGMVVWMRKMLVEWWWKLGWRNDFFKNTFKVTIIHHNFYRAHMSIMDSLHALIRYGKARIGAQNTKH